MEQLERVLRAVIVQGRVIEIATEIVVASIEYFVEHYIKEAEEMNGFNFGALINRQLNPAQQAEKDAYLHFCLEMFKFLLANGEARPPGCEHIEDIKLDSKLLSINNNKKAIYAAEVDPFVRMRTERASRNAVKDGEDEEELELEFEEETVDPSDDPDEDGVEFGDRSARGLSSDHYDVKLGSKGATTERWGKYQEEYRKMLEADPSLPKPAIYHVVDF